MSILQASGPEFDHDALVKIIRASVASSLPPAGFDPMTASDADLETFGFPSRPQPALQPAEFAFWQQMFASPLEFEPFDFDILPLFTAEGRNWVSSLPRRQSSFNWSGAYITPRDGMVFRTMWGKWQVPTPTLPAGGVAADKYRSSAWIGFDGQRRYYRSTLPQFGTSQIIDEATGVAKFGAWWQWWVRGVAGQAYPIVLTSPGIHAGDLILCYMKVKKNSSESVFRD